MASEAAVEGGIPSQKPEGKQKMTAETGGGRPSPGLFERVKNLRNLWRKGQSREDEGPESPSRRRFLKAATVATAVTVVGGVIAEEAVIGLARKALLGSSESGTEKLDIFSTIEKRLSSAKLSEAERQSALQSLEAIKNAHGYVTRAREVYESRTEPDGTPTLLKLERERWGQMDLSGFWQGFYSSEREFLEDKIFFLNHEKHFFNNVVKVLRGVVDGQAPDDQLARQVKAFYNTGGIVDSRISSYQRRSWDPKSPIGYNITNLEGTVLGGMQEVSSAFPYIGPVEVTVRDNGPTVDRGGQIEHKPDGTTNLLLFSRAIGAQAGPNKRDFFSYILAHEGGHAIDPDDNTLAIPSVVKPEDLVNLMIAKRRALADSSVGRNFPAAERLFGPNGRGLAFPATIKGPLSPNLFRQEAGDMADGIWVKGAVEIFGQYLSSDAIEGIYQEFQRQGEGESGVSIRNLSPAAKVWFEAHHYGSQAKFVQTEPDNLQKIATSSKYYRAGINRFRSDPSKFEGFQWLSAGFNARARVPTESIPSSWFKSLPTFVAVDFAQGFFNNDPEVVDLFSPSEQKEIRQKLINIFKKAEEEYFAEAIALTVRSGSQVFGGKRSPYSEFLDVAREIRSAVTVRNRE